MTKLVKCTSFFYGNILDSLSHKTMPNRKFLAKPALLNAFKKTALLGNVLTITGCLGLVLGITGLYDMQMFAIGLSSGVRIIGTIAIAGCLLSAIGYGVFDYLNDQ